MSISTWNTVPVPDRVAERGATKYTVEGACWISAYSVQSSGYAQVGWQDNGKTRMVLAHRAAWVHHNGRQVPIGMTIDHTCKNRRCVNPAHLRLLSNFENARRNQGDDWPVDGRCRNGHGPEHLMLVTKRGRQVRTCRLCTRESQRRWAARQRARRAS